MGEDTEGQWTSEPTVPGFYRYVGTLYGMVFIRTGDGRWWVWYPNGELHECTWTYIDQALGVFGLEQIKINMKEN